MTGDRHERGQGWSSGVIHIHEADEGRRMWEGTAEREAAEVRENQGRQRCHGGQRGTFQKPKVVKKVKVSKIK